MALACLLQTLDVTADIGAASGFFPLEVERNAALGITYHAQKFCLGFMFIASHAATHWDLFYLFFHFDQSS